MIGRSIIRISPRSSIVRETNTTATITPASRTTILQVGLPGPPGEQGPPGSGGGGGAAAYTHTQGPASSFWVITHNLGYRPAVQVWDTANDMVMGEVDHISPNQLSIEFSTAISGTAYMS